MKWILPLVAMAMLVTFAAYADVPPLARAASRPAVVTERPEGKFFRLPPRLQTRSTFSRAARFPGMMAKPQTKPQATAPLVAQTHASAPPTKDPNKLLLYVYDDLR